MRNISILLGLCVLSLSCMKVATNDLATNLNVPFKTGHIGILGPLDARKKSQTQAAMRDLEPLKGLRVNGISSIEEYVPWFWVEPEKGKFNWRIFDHHCEGVKAAGMELALSPFGHFVPDWVTQEEDFQGFVCKEHNKETTFPSIFAPSTLEYYERYYAFLAKHYEGKISSIYPAGTSDFGEIGYPHGVDQWNDHHMHEGWWIYDPYARASFSKYSEKKFGTVAKLNQSWGTRFPSFASITYPEDAQNRHRWLDFMDWYRTAQTDFMLELVALAKKYFPGIPIEIKLGQPDEKPIYGIDVAGLFKAGKKHGFSVRSTAAFVPPHVYKRISTTKLPISFFLVTRQATLANFYGLSFITEEFAGMPKEMSLPRIFTDATLGVDEVFVGPPTLMSALDYYQRFGPFIRGNYAITHTAFYYPLTDHLLKPRQQFPNGVFNAGNILREQMNYGVVDDQMIEDGALDPYQYLVMFDLAVMKESVLKAMESWVWSGGILVHPFAGENLDVLEGGAGSDETSLFQFRNNSLTTFEGSDMYMKRLGEGAVIAVRKPTTISPFYDVVVNVVHNGSQLVPGVVTEPAIDLAVDGVYASAFSDRVLLFNSGKRTVTKTFELSPKHFPRLPQLRRFSLELAPRSLQEVLLDDGEAMADAPAPLSQAAESSAIDTAPSLSEVRKRMQNKMNRFQKQMPIWVSSGGNPNLVRPKMKKFEQLLNSGKIAQAEDQLDAVLAIIENK